MCALNQKSYFNPGFWVILWLFFSFFVGATIKHIQNIKNI